MIVAVSSPNGRLNVTIYLAPTMVRLQISARQIVASKQTFRLEVLRVSRSACSDEERTLEPSACYTRDFKQQGRECERRRLRKITFLVLCGLLGYCFFLLGYCFFLLGCCFFLLEFCERKAMDVSS